MAMYIVVYQMLMEMIILGIEVLCDMLDVKLKEFMDVVKIGCIYFMDVMLVMVGQEFFGYVVQFNYGLCVIKNILFYLVELVFGGIVVGMGLNMFEGYVENVVKYIVDFIGLLFVIVLNKFEFLVVYDVIVELYGVLKIVVVLFMKIGNDICMLVFGFCCGIGEFIIFVNELGLFIMFGKVNLIQLEVLMMVMVQVVGNDVVINVGGMIGQFELNVFKLVMIFNFLIFVCLIGDVCVSFDENCVKGIEFNYDCIKQNFNNLLMLVIVLNIYIGYDNVVVIVKKVYVENFIFKEVAIELGLFMVEQFDEWVCLENMI